MKIYPDTVISTSQKGQIMTTITQNLIDQVTSNYQITPDFMVLIDEKYLLEGVTNVRIQRSKRQSANFAYVTLDNLDNRYTGINENKLTTNMRIDIFIGFNKEYYQKFSGYIDEVKTSTQPSSSTIDLTCRDRAKALIDRTISTATYTATYYGEGNWHSTVTGQDSDGNDIREGYDWVGTDIAKDVLLKIGLVEGTDFEIDDIRTTCQAEKGLTCAQCKRVFSNCQAVFQSNVQSTAPLLTNSTAPECLFASKEKCKFGKESFPCGIKDVCEYYSFVDLPEGYGAETDLEGRRGCQYAVKVNFTDEVVMDILAKVAQTMLWECYCDFQGKIVMHPPKSETDAIEFYFKEERDLTSISKDKTDDFLINDVQIIGYTTKEQRIVYPFQPIAEKDELSFERGEAKRNYKLSYPDCVSSDTWKTLTNYWVTTTCIEPRTVKYDSIASNPENHAWFDVRFHCPNYANPYDKDLVFEGTAVTGTTKEHGWMSRTWLFYDDNKIEGSKIYLSDIVYVQETGQNIETRQATMRMAVMPSMEMSSVEVASTGTSTAPSMVYYRTYDMASNTSTLYCMATASGISNAMLSGVSKEIIRYECTCQCEVNNNYAVREVKSPWAETQREFDGSDVVVKEINTSLATGGTNNVSSYGDNYYDTDGTLVNDVVYYAVIEKWYVNGSPASADQENIIRAWSTFIKNDNNYNTFYVTNSTTTSTGYAAHYYKYYPATGAKVEVNRIDWEEGANEADNVTVLCTAGGDLGRCHFNSITEESISISGENKADDLADEMLAIALICGEASYIAGKQVYIGSFGFVTDNSALAQAIILANAALWWWLGTYLTQGDPIEFGCRVWARRQEEILQKTNLANNDDGWLDKPSLSSYYDDDTESDIPCIEYQKDFGSYVPIRQIGFRPPPVDSETGDSIQIRFEIYAWYDDLYQPVAAKIEETLVDYAATDVSVNELGYWWEFFQRRDDFRLRNYMHLKLKIYKWYNETTGVDLLAQCVEQIKGGNPGYCRSIFFDTTTRHASKCFFIPDVIVHSSDVENMANRWENSHSSGIQYPEYYVKQVGQELFSVHDVAVGKKMAIMDIENWFLSNPATVDIRVWAKAYGKFAPTLIIEQESDEMSKFQYNERQVTLTNTLITSDEVASKICNSIIDSAKGELDVYEWESLGKLYLHESQIVTVKEETLGLKSGLQSVWECSYPLNYPRTGYPALETANSVLICNQVNDPLGDQVIEVDQNGNQIWYCNQLGVATDAKRLSYHGGTLITDAGARKVFIVDYLDAGKKLWEYTLADTDVPFCADKYEDLIAIGVTSTTGGYITLVDYGSKTEVGRIEGLGKIETIQLIVDKTWEEVSRTYVHDYSNARVLIADSTRQRVSIYHRDGREIWAYYKNSTKPTSAQYITASKTVLICDAGQTDISAGKLYEPYIIEVDMQLNTVWLVKYTSNPDPWYTLQNVCQYFQPTHAYKDLQNEIIVVEQYPCRCYKIRPMSNFYTTEVTDTFTRGTDSDSYMTSFKAVPVEQSAFLHLTSFGNNYINDQTYKKVESSNQIATAKIVAVLGSERYSVQMLGDDEILTVSNATLETFRVNDSVLIGYEYADNTRRSIVGRKIANFPDLETGDEDDDDDTYSTSYLSTTDSSSSSTSSSIDVSYLQNQINALKQRVTSLEAKI